VDRRTSLQRTGTLAEITSSVLLSRATAEVLPQMSCRANSGRTELYASSPLFAAGLWSGRSRVSVYSFADRQCTAFSSADHPTTPFSSAPLSHQCMPRSASGLTSLDQVISNRKLRRAGNARRLEWSRLPRKLLTHLSAEAGHTPTGTTSRTLSDRSTLTGSAPAAEPRRGREGAAGGARGRRYCGTCCMVILIYSSLFRPWEAAG
jgi:hypothetical protein